MLVLLNTFYRLVDWLPRMEEGWLYIVLLLHTCSYSVVIIILMVSITNVLFGWMLHLVFPLP